MSRTDKVFIGMCKDIIDNGFSSEGQDIRPKWDDGSPAHTIKQFGVINRYNLQEEFPILTLRPINFKAAVDELLWLYQRQSNNVKDLNSKIWDQWADENGSIGRAYAYQLESRPKEQIVKIKPKAKKEKPLSLKKIKIKELQNYNKNCKDEKCGKIIESQNSGKFIILDIFNSNKENNYLKMAKIQFLNSGFIKETTKNNALNGKVKDPYFRRVKGIGYEGDLSSVNLSKETINILRKVWANMISRCYDIKNNRYNSYGMKGFFVSDEWHNFSTFLKDMVETPQFFMAKQENFKEWTIDKDYFGSNYYSKETCVWIINRHNKIYSSANKYNIKNLQAVLSEKTNETKGFSAKYIKDEFLYRFELSKNQVNDVIYQLKNNPFSRRIMTNFWNLADMSYKALQECAYSMTFNVSDGKLNAILNQRSQDVLVANSWNVCQYAILVHMFAQVSGLEVGEFVHVIADAHIYDKHVPIVKELIKRESFDAPKLIINKNIKDFYSFTVDDFKLENYNTGETIKRIPVAI